MNSSVGNRPEFSFQASEENVNGKYLKMTHIREQGGWWTFAGVITIVLWVACIVVLVNWEMFTPARMMEAKPSGGLYGRMAVWLALPVSLIGVVSLPWVSGLVWATKWKDGKGWTVRDSSFAKWYGKRLLKKPKRFREAASFYFDTYERHPMRATFYDDRIDVSLSGKNRKVLYSQLYRTYKSKGLFVARVVSDEDGAWDVIVDLSQLSKSERKAFLHFMKAKKADFIKSYSYEEPWNPRPESRYR